MRGKDVLVKIIKIKVCQLHNLEACRAENFEGKIIDLRCSGCTISCAFRGVSIANLAQVAKIGNVKIIPTCCDESGLLERKNAL